MLPIINHGKQFSCGVPAVKQLLQIYMLKKISSVENIKELSQLLHSQNHKIILVGGCFDIIHIGHVFFLTEAKKLGTYLIVLLENDARLKQLKGANRPLFSQKIRGMVLSSLTPVDAIIMLPFMNNDHDYEKLIATIRPHVIAATANDSLLEKKRRQADRIKAKFVTIPYKKSLSTSALARILGLK